MLDKILSLFGLQRIPHSSNKHKIKFEEDIKILIDMVEAINIEGFCNYTLFVDIFRFTFDSHKGLTKFTIYTSDTWMVRSQFEQNAKYNKLRLADDNYEAWQCLTNATEQAIEKIKQQDQEKQAKNLMNILVNAN